ncbi:serine--tRNA ligase, partial [Candidatus Kuenenbacteria bacterium]|nr:serine--tRNA ligase [Candidatus Kuenenbacteria bacterium]
MLDIKFIRQNPEIVKEACRKKQAKIDIDLLLEVDEKKRKLLQTLEEIRAKKNKASLQIRELKNEEEKKKIILEMRELDKDSGEIAKNLDESENKFNDLMSVIPNIPLDSVPVGA